MISQTLPVAERAGWRREQKRRGRCRTWKSPGWFRKPTGYQPASTPGRCPGARLHDGHRPFPLSKTEINALPPPGGSAAVREPASPVVRAAEAGGGSRGPQKGDHDPGRPPANGLAAEPEDHALGRSRGGLTTKIHLAVETSFHVLSAVITTGQSANAPVFTKVMDRIRVPRPAGGRPRVRPSHLLADRAYSSRQIREYLRRRQIPHTIPEKRDQAGHRLRRGSAGGRPPGVNRDMYKRRHKVECRKRTTRVVRARRTRRLATSTTVRLDAQQVAASTRGAYRPAVLFRCSDAADGASSSG